ncbi:VanZ family protein [Paenibacillus sp. strain BS8-2]
MKDFDTYLTNILKNVDASSETKHDLYSEFLDHLEQLRMSYVADGAKDEHAIKMAIDDFGESDLLSGLMNKAISPNRKWLQPLAWCVFATYAIVVVYQLLLSPMRLSYRGILPPLSNLTPFRSLLQYAEGFQHYEFETWFFNLFGNVLLFVPLGFLLPILVVHARRFILMIIWTLIVSLVIELTQFGARLGVFDVDDLILNVLGGAIGYGAWIICAAGWRLALRKMVLH